jgi:hypothetical protein
MNNINYKELFKLINDLPDGAVKDLSEIIRKNKEANPNGFTYEQVKTQIEKFHGKRNDNSNKI